MKDVLIYDKVFVGQTAPPVVGSPDGQEWRSKVTKTAGSPTVLGAAGGMVLTLDSTSEVQNLCLYHGDILSFPIDALISFDLWGYLTGSMATGVTLSAGLASARNDAIASLSQSCLFQCAGSSALVVTTKDGTHSNSAVATGETMPTSLYQIGFNFSEGINTQVEALSTGGKSRVHAFANNSRGQLRRVLANTTIDLSAYSGNFQPFVQLQKTAVAAARTFTVQRIRIAYRNV